MILTSYINFLTLERKYSIHTVNAYNKDIHFFLDFIINTYEIDNLKLVNYSMIRSWIVILVEQGLSNTSINRKIASLKSFYKFLIKIKQIKENPLSKHKSLKIPKNIQIPFSREEMENVLNLYQASTDFETVRDLTLIELFYATGIRKTELIEIKTGDVDFYNSTLKVLGKRNKERIIPLLPKTIDAVKKYLAIKETQKYIKDTDQLFISKNGVKISQSLVYRIINKYFSEVTTKMKKSPHIIRHSFATHILNEGADLNSVKELLGHTSLASTQVYTHNSIEELKKVYKETHPRNK